MNTRDLQRTDELVTAADLAVRLSSQLRLWLKRRSFTDTESINFGIAFLDDALNGGRFIGSDKGVAGVANLEPLSWTADLKFSPVDDQDSQKSVDYEDLIKFVLEIQTTLEQVKAGSISGSTDHVMEAANFFRQLGQHLGTKADEALRTPTTRFFLSGDRYSGQ